VSTPVESSPASTEISESPADPKKVWDSAALMVIINGVLAGVGSIFVTTHSVLITVVACGAAVFLAAFIAFLQCERSRR
jgi:hypothetical protein